MSRVRAVTDDDVTCRICGSTGRGYEFPRIKYWDNRCRTCLNNYYREWRKNNRPRVSLKKRNQIQKLRLEMLIHYSGNPPLCACCGEKEIEFLQLDHINNDGAQHKELLYGERTLDAKFYRYMRRLGFPPGLQVLCANCNTGRYRNGGTCPHLGKSSSSYKITKPSGPMTFPPYEYIAPLKIGGRVHHV